MCVCESVAQRTQRNPCDVFWSHSAFGYNVRCPCAERCLRLISSFGPTFYFVCVPILFLAHFLSLSFAYSTKASKSSSARIILLCLRFDSLINLLVRTKVENILSHYLYPTPSTQKIVNAVFMCCVYVCDVCKRVRAWRILHAVGSSTSICLSFIYKYIVQFRCQKICPSPPGGCQDVVMCVVRERRSQSHTCTRICPLYEQFGYTSGARYTFM